MHRIGGFSRRILSRTLLKRAPDASLYCCGGVVGTCHFTARRPLSTSATDPPPPFDDDMEEPAMDSSDHGRTGGFGTEVTSSRTHARRSIKGLSMRAIRVGPHVVKTASSKIDAEPANMQALPPPSTEPTVPAALCQAHFHNPFTGRRGKVMAVADEFEEMGFAFRGTVDDVEVYIHDAAKLLQFAERFRRKQVPVRRSYEQTLYVAFSLAVQNPLTFVRRHLENIAVARVRAMTDARLSIESSGSGSTADAKSKSEDSADGDKGETDASRPSQQTHKEGSREARKEGEVLQRPGPITLNAEQLAVLELACKGYNLYIGGSAGTGKTALLKALRHVLESRMGLQVSMTATTGVAACQIDGRTLHSAMALRNGTCVDRNRLLSNDVLIIDECSMLNAEDFEMLDTQMRFFAGNSPLAFGGVQVILCGDFMQLPATRTSILNSALFRENFAMTSLQTVIRQGSQGFVRQLRELRLGAMPPELLLKAALPPVATAHVGRPQASEVLEIDDPVRDGDTSVNVFRHTSSTGEQVTYHVPHGAVFLCPRVSQSVAINKKELEQIPGESITMPTFLGTPELVAVQSWSDHYVFKTRPGFRNASFRKWVFERMNDVMPQLTLDNVVVYRMNTDTIVLRCRVPSTVENEEEAKVMLQTAMHRLPTAIAAALAEVPEGAESPIGASFASIGAADHPYFTARDEAILRDLQQNTVFAEALELKVGCQVMLRCNLSKVLVNGLVGRVVGFAPLDRDFVERLNRFKDDAMSYLNLHQVEGRGSPVLPIVKFSNGATIVVPPHRHIVGGLALTNYYQSHILTLPLTLAYAFTVHKVQGLTLGGRVHLELSQMWPCDHLLYVAMSRVKDPSQLSMSGFSPHMLRVSKDALVFDQSLPTPQEAEKLIPPHIFPAMWKRFPEYRKAMRERLRERSVRRRVQKALMLQKALQHTPEGPRLGTLTTDMPAEAQADACPLSVDEGLHKALLAEIAKRDRATRAQPRTFLTAEEEEQLMDPALLLDSDSSTPASADVADLLPASPTEEVSVDSPPLTTHDASK